MTATTSAAAGRRDVEVRRLQHDDLAAYLALRDTSFGYPDGEKVRQELVDRLAVTWGAFVDGRLAASLGDPRFEVFVAGRAVPMCGIAAVQTAPEHRRGGFAARLMHVALAEARDAGVGWSLLYPFDPRFYARFGWLGLATGVELALPPERLGVARPVAAKRLTAGLREGLQELHARCAANWTFANARTLGPWDIWAELLPAPGRQGVAYRLDDAYVVLQHRYERDPHGPTLRVLDHGYASAAGREDLMAFLASFEGQSAKVVIDVPSTDPLAWSWSGWYPQSGRKTLMARVADVPSALARMGGHAAASPGEPARAFTIGVRDAFAPWNDGAWRVAPDGDGCVVTRAATADAWVDARGLAALASGAATPTAARLAGLAEGDDRVLQALAALSGGRTPYQAPVDDF
jgi:predicted acetyltransferase